MIDTAENSRELESLEGLDGYAYLRALTGRIGGVASDLS